MCPDGAGVRSCPTSILLNHQRFCLTCHLAWDIKGTHPSQTTVCISLLPLWNSFIGNIEPSAELRSSGMAG